MKSVEIIAYEAKHALEIKTRQMDMDERKTENFEAWAKFNENGAAFTGLYEGKIVGCAGVRVLWKGVGEAWAVFSPNVIHLVKEAYVYVDKYLQIIMEDHGLWRVQCHVRTDLDIFSHYVENLGFEREGLMRKYGYDGKDRYLYSYVR